MQLQLVFNQTHLETEAEVRRSIRLLYVGALEQMPMLCCFCLLDT